MDKAMETYTSEWYFANDASASNWNTWREFHDACWDHHGFPDEHIAPLAPLKIHIVRGIAQGERLQDLKELPQRSQNSSRRNWIEVVRGTGTCSPAIRAVNDEGDWTWTPIATFELRTYGDDHFRR